jgi:hypothetical protein
MKHIAGTTNAFSHDRNDDGTVQPHQEPVIEAKKTKTQSKDSL